MEPTHNEQKMLALPFHCGFNHRIKAVCRKRGCSIWVASSHVSTSFTKRRYLLVWKRLAILKNVFGSHYCISVGEILFKFGKNKVVPACSQLCKSNHKIYITVAKFTLRLCNWLHGSWLHGSCRGCAVSPMVRCSATHLQKEADCYCGFIFV